MLMKIWSSPPLIFPGDVPVYIQLSLAKWSWPILVVYLCTARLIMTEMWTFLVGINKPFLVGIKCESIAAVKL